MAEIIHDQEFGDIEVRRYPNARYARLRIEPGGKLLGSLPLRGPLRLIAQLIHDSRADLRKVLTQKKYITPSAYRHGDRVSPSHRIEFEPANSTTPIATVRSGTIRVRYPATASPADPTVQQAASQAVKRALKANAQSELPKRLLELSQKTGIQYRSVSFGNAKGRWGSCTSRGDIRLNIALMTLPEQLRDYVLTHELCHIKHMNHSPKFWQLVESTYPNYRAARKQLGSYSPHL